MMMRGTGRRRGAWAALAALVVGVASAGTSARADFLFNPQGDGNPANNFDVNSIDAASGNALAKGGVTAINAGPGNTFQLYYQASVSDLVLTNGATFTPPGLGSPGAPGATYELTIVASVTEVVTSVNVASGTATFAVAPGQSANSFLKIYYGSGAAFNASPLAGTGYNDGTLILSGSPVSTPAGGGNFSNTGTTGLFDQFDHPDAYGGKQSVVGHGSSVVDFRVLSTNGAFFVTPPATVTGLDFNTTNTVPFTTIPPSMLFAGLGPGNTDVIPNLGAVNGQSGPDFQFVAHAAIAPLAIPEPSSLLLTAGGILGLFIVRRTRKARA